MTRRGGYPIGKLGALRPVGKTRAMASVATALLVSAHLLQILRTYWRLTLAGSVAVPGPGYGDTGAQFGAG
jgi:hypothetical protein